jgi:hypothetical protein
VVRTCPDTGSCEFWGVIGNCAFHWGLFVRREWLLLGSGTQVRPKNGNNRKVTAKWPYPKAVSKTDIGLWTLIASLALGALLLCWSATVPGLPGCSYAVSGRFSFRSADSARSQTMVGLH